MIALLQRVNAASVRVGDAQIAEIKRGLLVFVGVEQGDEETECRQLAKRLLSYRVFPDDAGKMNLSVQDINGALLLVPQFTLAADTTKGLRPSFARAAEPKAAARLFAEFTAVVRAEMSAVECGEFGADMQVSLVNDGPVTFWLQT